MCAYGARNDTKLPKSGNLKALNDLRALGIARFERRSGELVVEVPELFGDDRAVVGKVLRDLMESMPGAVESFSALESDPTASAESLGAIIASG